jgi:hypothetical protein
MRISLSFLLFVFSITAWSQKTGNPQRFAKLVTATQLQKHLAVIASRDMEGRETATAGQRKAAAYIESEFKRIGLQPGANGNYQQVYPVYQDSITSARLEVDSTTFTWDKDFTVSAYNSYTATLRFSSAVYLSPLITDDSIKKLDLAGKLVLLLPAAGNRYAYLDKKGITAILLINSDNAPANRRRLILQPFKESYRPQMAWVTPNVAQAILKTPLDSAKALTKPKVVHANILFDVKTTLTSLQSTNVVGVLPGTDLKDQYLFITAHYDHLGKRGDSVIYYGADDDGSGTVSVLTLADAFTQAKKAGNGPRRSIVFMAASGEEKGLWGSDYYSSHPLFPLERTTADLNIDMIGRSDSSRRGDTMNYVYVVGDDKLSSDLRPISESANARYTKLALDYKFNDTADKEHIYFRSDHYNFAKKGVPIIFYYDGMLGADYHKPTDTPEKIHYDLLAKRAQLVFYTAWEMANRPQLLKRDRPLPELRR